MIIKASLFELTSEAIPEYLLRKYELRDLPEYQFDDNGLLIFAEPMEDGSKFEVTFNEISENVWDVFEIKY